MIFSLTERGGDCGWLVRLLVTGGCLATQVFLCASPSKGSQEKVGQTLTPGIRITELSARLQLAGGGKQNPTSETAQQEMDAAGALCQSATAEDLRKAFKKYEVVRVIWETARDKRHLALTLLRMGQVLSSLHNDAQAAVFLTDARQIGHEIGDSNIEAEAQLTNAMLLLRHGDLQGSLSQVEAVYTITVRNENHALQSIATASLAEIYYDLGDLARGSDRALESLKVSKQANIPKGIARGLYWIGCINVAKRDYDNAVRLFEESLAVARAAHDRPIIVDTLTQIGGLYSMVGQKQRALETFVALEPQAELLADPEKLARLYSGLDSVNQELGNTELSLRYCQKTIEMYHAANYAVGEAQIYVRLGGIQTRLGKYAEALSNYQRALTFFLQNGMTRYTYYVLSDLGELYATQGNDSLAGEYYARAQQLIKAGEDPREYSYLLNRVGRVSERTKGAEAALEYYRHALTLNRSTKDRFGESQTLRLISGAEKKLNDFQEADTAIKAAIAIDEKLRDEVAVSDLRTSYFSEVSEHFDFYIDLLMRESGDNGANKLKALEISERKRARTLLDEVAPLESVASGATSAGAALVDRERQLKTRIEAKRDEYAKLKQDRQSAARAEGVAVELLTLSQEYDQLHSVIRSLGVSKSSSAAPPPLTAKEIQAVIDDPSTLLLEYSLGEERTFLWGISSSEIKSYELPKRSVIEQEVLELNRTIKLMTPSRTLKDQGARSLGVQAADDFRVRAQRLTQILLAPAVHQIVTAKRLVIVADGALHYVPFTALPQLEEADTGGTTNLDARGEIKIRPLLANYEITLLPSVSFLAAARHRAANMSAPSKTMAIIANPVFEQDDERLRRARSDSIAQTRTPGRAPPSRSHSIDEAEVRGTTTEVNSRLTAAVISQVLRDTDVESPNGILPRLFSTQREALEIQSLAGAERSFVALDFDANRKILTSETLKDYRYIHIATHGFFDSTHPELSGIVLSLYDQEGRPQDGFVEIRDIFNLDLNADIVVLSACQTGLGKQVKGEGLTGLAQAFMVAGARRVVASLWKVDDDATAELMTDFYRHLLKEKSTPSSALRAAQLEISATRKWREPFYWAGFFISGEFR
ncbi:MAG: Tetratricopeptide 1 repeat-containing protein [Acidobacteria bacterium]|nr:Tetratricopeptide 1 repeat-containing protein [Acidobacteriota bacterium]